MPDRGAQLRAVPEKAPRALGLVRVSKERDGMVSPDIQRTSITDHAARAGYDVTGWLEGIDESGSQARSSWWARLDQAVVAVEAGEYDVVLVWKFSRIARHRLRWAVAIDRVETAGGRIESATEAVDVTTSTGRFTRGMLAELQAFEAERIGETWKEAHARRVASGRPANGKPRFGYRYDPDAKIHRPDPDTGPVLADLYRRYVAGESMYTLVRWLNAHGWRTTAGGAWTDVTLRRVLDSGFAAGLFAVRGDLHTGVHEALVDADTWQAYLDARAVRRARPVQTERSAYLLSGLLRCARCGGPMVAGQHGWQRTPKYRCQPAVKEGPTRCVGGYAAAHLVEAQVVAWLEQLAAEVDTAAERAAAGQAAAAGRRAALAAEETRLAREAARVDEALTRLAVQNAEHPLPASVYAAAYDDLAQRAGQLQAALDDARRQARRAVAEPARVAAALLEGWAHRSVAVRREVLRSLVNTVLVRSRPAGAGGPVVVVVEAWHDEAPRGSA